MKIIIIIQKEVIFINKTTEPIRNKKTLKAIELYLKNINYRNYALFKTQLNTGLRISDVIKLKYDDFFLENGKFKKHIELTEKKTKKNKVIFINDDLKKTIRSLVERYKLNKGSYLFKSRKGQNRPITTTQAHRIYKNIGDIFNLPNFNTHSIRKTFCYYIYQKNKDINLIMKLMNHSSTAITLRYIGITDDDIDNIYNDLDF